MEFCLIKIRIGKIGHLHKEEEDGEVGGDSNPDIELHCLHLEDEVRQTGKMRSG